MEGGDLSNSLPPRWLFVFEGVIGRLPLEKARAARLWARAGQWRRVAELYEVEPHVQKVIWDLTWRRDYRFDIVTFYGEPFAAALEKRLSRESLPFSNLWAVDEDTLAQRLVYMPDVQYVIHADPARHLSYGPRGLLVTEPGALNLW